MVAYKNKIRVSVPLNQDINEKVNVVADKLHMSKATLCATLIEQYLDVFEKTYTLLQNPTTFKALIDQTYKEINSNMDVIIEALNNDNKE